MKSMSGAPLFSGARSLITGLSLAILGVAISNTQAAANEGLPVPDKLLELNGEFRKIYAQTRGEALAANNPTIICFGDKIQLNDGAHKDSAPMVPQQYTVLKTVDHVPLAVFSLLAGPQFKESKESRQQPAPGALTREKSSKISTEPLSGADLAELKKLIDLTEAARPALNTYINDPASGLSKATIVRQASILDQTEAFSRTAIKSGVNAGTLRNFTRSLSPLLLANAQEAIAAQLATIDTKVGQWKKELGPAKWKRLKVVVVSGHMPRDRHAVMQYFEKILGEKQEGGRVIYSEGAQDEETALTLIATHDLDRSIAVNFFNEKERMHRDLLCDGAAKYLRKAHLAGEE